MTPEATMQLASSMMLFTSFILLMCAMGGLLALLIHVHGKQTEHQRLVEMYRPRPVFIETEPAMADNDNPVWNAFWNQPHRMEQFAC